MTNSPAKTQGKAKASSGTVVAFAGMPTSTDAATQKASPRAQTILIIDDDPVITFLLRNYLDKAGYHCLVARDGESAWQVLSPDVSLVLLDIMMPGQNGPEILRRMRQDPMLADIPVIFVTGRTDAATRIQCLAMGAVGFVVKPFHAKDVLAQVRQALERSPALDETGDDDATDPLEVALETEFAPSSGLSGELTVADLESMPVSQLLRSLLAERRGTRRSLASHRRLVSALFRLHQAMSEGESPHELARSVVVLAQKALRATRAEIWVPSGGGLVRLAALGGERASDDAPDVAIALDGPEPAAQVWRDWLTIERESREGEIEIHFPLTVGTERIGIMSLAFPAASRPSESLSSFFCAEVALALDSAIRLERAQSEALTDALTGVHNRRFLEARLADELRRAKQLGYPTSLLFIDLDRFKEVNDTYGHDVGDQLLRNVATLLAAELRAVDVIARFGGDEFVVILPETDRAGSVRVASRLQEALARRGLEGMPDGCDVTFTIGTATSPEDGTRPSDLLVSADSAMLRGKRAGRNRIEMFGHESEPSATESPRREETAVLRTLIAALEVRDRGTAKHSREVAALSARIARHMGCDADMVRVCGQAGLLHDIGKLHTPLEILLKPGPLDEVERTVMNLHAEIGAELAESLAPVRHLAPAIRASQEFFDGSGYPDGIAGDAIPLPSRIIAVADAYHAMRNDRPYRAALPEDVAIAELRRYSGTQFDPAVVDALLELLREDQRMQSRAIQSAA
jgi:diguanylate cyclase (GGDEF)-like protein/putative nucleotidyltransferase with HDIG domain